MRHFLLGLAVLLLSGCISLLPGPDISTPEKTLRYYYAKVNSGDCKNAIKLRPHATLESCRAIDVGSVKIEKLQSLMAAKSNSQVFELHLSYTKNRHPKRFKGYIAVFKGSRGWYIQDNSMVSADFITRYAYLTHYGYNPPAPVQPKQPVTTGPSPVPVPDAVVQPAPAQPLPQLEPQPLPKPKPPISTTPPEKRIVVDISRQRLDLYYDDKVTHSYPVSTSKYGIGNRAGSGRTPLGKHIIADKIGAGARPWTVFKARANTGRIAEPMDNDADDLVTTRILWLKGLEAGKNKGSGIDSYRRYIYIHGTAEEHLIGRPASHGCIRMYNNDVIKLFNLVEEGTPVDIQR
jgi:lipoprotein-anchoring transpeptidase ErfK/SrfK